MNGFLSTKDLEQYIKAAYARVEHLASEDGVFHPLSCHFDVKTPRGEPGSFCFSDDKGYHFGSIDIRGRSTANVLTQSLFEITYETLSNPVFWTALEYERRNRIESQDNRRIMFEKRLQYWNAVGAEYAEREKAKIDEVLLEHPFEDNRIIRGKRFSIKRWFRRH